MRYGNKIFVGEERFREERAEPTRSEVVSDCRGPRSRVSELIAGEPGDEVGFLSLRS